MAIRHQPLYRLGCTVIGPQISLILEPELIYRKCFAWLGWETSTLTAPQLDANTPDHLIQADVEFLLDRQVALHVPINAAKNQTDWFANVFAYGDSLFAMSDSVGLSVPGGAFALALLPTKLPITADEVRINVTAPLKGVTGFRWYLYIESSDKPW